MCDEPESSKKIKVRIMGPTQTLRSSESFPVTKIVLQVTQPHEPGTGYSGNSLPGEVELKFAVRVWATIGGPRRLMCLVCGGRQRHPLPKFIKCSHVNSLMGTDADMGPFSN